MFSQIAYLLHCRLIEGKEKDGAEEEEEVEYVRGHPDDTPRHKLFEE